MREEFQLPGGVLPSKEALLNYKLASLFHNNISVGQAFLEGFVPNENQLRVEQIIETSTVPEGQWIHILLYGEPRSGKTWAALYYIIKHSLAFAGARFLMVRSTASELNTSVFLDVDKFADKWNIPVNTRSTQNGLIEFGNKSQLWAKSDKSLTPGARDNTSRKMGGMEYCGAMVEETDTISWETARAIPHRLSQSVDFRKVIFYTMNPPSEGHWSWEFFFKNPLGDPDDPASPIRAVHCPLSGNLQNIGEAYQSGLMQEYQDDPAMHRRFALGQFAPAIKGDPIYRKSFKREFHVAQDSFLKQWNTSLPMYRGWDFGWRGNVCIVCQDDIDRNQFRYFLALFQRKIQFEQFCEDALKQCYRLFPGAEWRDFPDPHGDQHTALNERSYHEIMQSFGLDPIFDKRRKSVILGVNLISKELRSQGRAGQPALIIDPGANYIIDMFESGYCNSKGCLKDEFRPVEDDTYCHVADGCRYPLVMNREFPLDGSNSPTITPFRVIQDADKIRENLKKEEGMQRYLGPTRQGGYRDGAFSRSRFSR